MVKNLINTLKIPNSIFQSIADFLYDRCESAPNKFLFELWLEFAYIFNEWCINTLDLYLE